MGKLTGYLLLPLLLIGRPQDIRSRWVGFGALAFLAAVLPNLLWQGQHDFVTFRFQGAHGLGIGTQEGKLPLLGGLLRWFGGQVGIASPLLFLAIAAFWFVGWKEQGFLRICWWTSFPVFFLFGFASLFGPAEPNWTAPAWVGAILALGHLSYRWRRVAWVGIGFAAVFSAGVMVHVMHPLIDLPHDPTLRLIGGEVLGQAVNAWGYDQVFTSRYQEAAWIRFYGHLPARPLPGVGRPSQFDLWNIPIQPGHALFVRPWRRSPPTELEAFWNERAGPNSVVARDDLLRIAGRWQVWEVWDYRGDQAGFAPPNQTAGPDNEVSP